MSSAIKLRLTAREYRVDPWTVFRNIREQGPVVPVKSLLLGNGWAVTTYEAVNSVFKDDQLFVRDPANAGRNTFGRIQHILPRSFMALTNNMLGKDGLDHRRLRGFVDQAFARRNIDAMSGRLEQLAMEQISGCMEIARSKGTVDLVKGLSRPFPFLVICELLGLPKNCREDVNKWLAPISDFKGPLDFFRMIRGIKKMKAFLIEQFSEARKNPREGLIGELIALQVGSERLNDEELLAMVFLLFVAGHETTVHLINNCILTLTEKPELSEELQNDWSKCDTFIEEVLRHCSPIQLAKPRFVSQDTKLFGVPLQRGQMILPLIASANYDPARFSNPDHFDMNREANYHLTFGSGPHTCLGIKLARSETAHAIKALVSHWPNFQPMFELENPDWSKRPGIRGLRSFVVGR